MALRDLSQPLATGMPVFPGDPAVEIEPAATIDGDGFRVSSVGCGSHTGTHIDAPSHTEADGAPIDAYDVDRFVFDARVVDVRGLDPREPIEASAVPDPDGADLLVFRTGWDAHWGRDRYLDHPYLSPAAAERCVAADCSVAVDALNPDPTPSANATADEPAGFPVHAAILGADLFIIENLTGLGGFERATLYAFPLPIEAGDGAPIRAVAETVEG